MWALHTMWIYNDFEHWIKSGIISVCLAIANQTLQEIIIFSLKSKVEMEKLE